MQLKRKIFNDPLYGLIRFPFDSIYTIIDHPYFQRLRRIRQLGLSSYVYTGATHSRFHHALGVAHLADRLVSILRSKNVMISELEHEGVVLAALLHDIGHGPFSHVLEHGFLDQSHEQISIEIMELLNVEFHGLLDMAIRIFTGKYERSFFQQMISSQLDVDRLDYLNRDSYYTGVVEGTVGCDRILAMMNVANDRLVVEEKGVYSVEKFLHARRYMYKQVYLHKVVILLDEMLKSFLQRYIRLHINELHIDNRLLKLLRIDKNFSLGRKDVLNYYLELDDIDIFAILKNGRWSEDVILSYLANAILDRKLFSIQIEEKPIEGDLDVNVRLKVAEMLSLTNSETDYLVKSGVINSMTYGSLDEIEILKKTKSVVPISQIIQTLNINSVEHTYYLCFPSIIE